MDFHGFMHDPVYLQDKNKVGKHTKEFSVQSKYKESEIRGE